jgi:quercetin dioxygenase-like cupin family protein
VEATRVDFAPGQAMPPHHHTAPVVCIVADGSFAVKIGGKPETLVATAGVTFEAPGQRAAYFRNASRDHGAALLCTVLAADGDAPINVMDPP